MLTQNHFHTKIPQFILYSQYLYTCRFSFDLESIDSVTGFFSEAWRPLTAVNETITRVAESYVVDMMEIIFYQTISGLIKKI